MIITIEDANDNHIGEVEILLPKSKKDIFHFFDNREYTERVLSGNVDLESENVINQIENKFYKKLL